ncbi:MAG: hypothetical protein EB060_11690, partial [Proteobacteria bacterium]|nr:hypothetical protein [Pseudomonadota bacterium]
AGLAIRCFFYPFALRFLGNDLFILNASPKPIRPVMYLSDLVQKIAMERDLESATIGQYHRACSKLGSFLGKIAEVSDLSEENVNAFLSSLKDLGKSATTIINYRVAFVVSVADQDPDRCVCSGSRSIAMRRCDRCVSRGLGACWL